MDSRQGVHELLAPDILPVEALHALTRAERRGILSAGDGWILWQSMVPDLPALHPHMPLLKRACEISSATRHGVYDCLYVALAELESCELVTADDKLVRNLQPTFPFVLALSSFP